MLIAKNVPTLPVPERGQIDYWDDLVPGLAARVSAQGRRTYVVRYRVAGRQRRMTLGQVTILSLADARELARRALRAVAAGDDPQAAKAARRHRGAAFGDMARRFMEENGPSMRPVTRQAWERYVRKEILPALGDHAPSDITRGDIRAFVRAIATRAPIAANRAFEVVRRIFSWAVAEELVDASPCVGLGGKRKQKRVLLAEEKPRDRIYSSDEIRAIFAALPGTQLEDLVPLIFHTATRSEETRAATWSQIDFDARLWTIPPERSKNGKAHPVPLSSGAMKALDRIRERQAARPSEYLFPAFSRAGYMEKPNKATRRMQQSSPFGGSGIEDFRLHDCRRTVATGLAELGTSDAVVEAVLGHARPELQRTYNLYSPVREMRVALEAWSARLDRVVTGTNTRAEVIPLSA